jgi:hypothetical protein
VKWYGITATAAAAASAPPAYAAERISDLVHASEVSKVAPGEARKLLDVVISQFSSHHNEELASRLGKASGRILDNPDLARQIIAEVIGGINAAVRRHDKERSDPWRKQKT